MSIHKIISEIDKATKTIDKISTLFDSKPGQAKKALSAEERERRVKARIREKGLQAIFRDIYPEL